MRPEWVIDVRDRCEREGVPFFFKQWGGPTPKAKGRILEGIEYNGVPRYLVAEEDGGLQMAS